MKSNLIVYVVTQFASQANRRVVKVLDLHESFDRMTLVCERGDNIYGDSLFVKKPRNMTGLLRVIGLDGLKRKLDQFLYFPSPAVLYTKQAAKSLKTLIKEDLQNNRRVCLMTMTPPHELLLIGLEIKRELPEVYWIIDWQDLWSYDEYYFDRVAESKRNKVREIEKQVFATCDISVVTNPYAQAVLENQYKVLPDKVTTISHPFDYREFNGSIGANNGSGSIKNGPIKIGFLGHILKLPKVPGDRVLRAVSHARQSGIDVALHVYGDMQTETREAVSGLDWVTLHDRASHEESLKLISDCDFLLLTLSDLPNTRIIMHAKLPHYFMLSKPIIAMVPDASFVASVVRETGTGYVISTDEDWGESLTKVLTEYKNDGIKPNRNEEIIQRYSWEFLSQRWISLINRAGNAYNGQNPETGN